MWNVDFAVILTTFPVIFLAELPDKTFIAALVLATRFRHLWVWLGVSAAFFIQCLIAVVAGGFIALLPAAPVLAVTSLLFAIGGLVLVRGGLQSRAQEMAEETMEESEVLAKVANAPSDSASRAFITSFLVLFAAEWGDLTQIFTAAQAAKTGQPLAVFIGSWLALVSVGGLAVILGRWLQNRVPLSRVRIASGVAMLLLALWTAYELVRELSLG